MNTPIHMMTRIDEFCDETCRGISCQFIRLTDTVGLKLYFNKFDGKKSVCVAETRIAPRLRSEVLEAV